MWQDLYELKDEQTVRNTSVKDFQAVNLRNALDLLVSYPENPDIQRDYPARVLEDYQRCQRAYDRRENLFRNFELDSEYFPIVITRSLLPQVGQSLERKDYQTAYMISNWIMDNVSLWEMFMCEFASRLGKSARELQKHETAE